MAYYAYAITLDKLSRPDEAIAAYRQAVRLVPDYDMAHNNLGAALLERGDADEAIAEYRLALSLNPSNRFAPGGLADALRQKGDLDGALAEFRVLSVILRSCEPALAASPSPISEWRWESARPLSRA